MSQGKRSRPAAPSAPVSAPKAPNVPGPRWGGAIVPSGNYEYYGLRPPTVGAVQARPLPFSPAWKPPDWLLEYHGLRPAKPAEGQAPPTVQQKEPSAEMAAEEEAKASDKAETRPPEAARGPVVQGKLSGGAPSAVQLSRDGYHGVGGWLHKYVYEPLQRDYDGWIQWGVARKESGGVTGALEGFVPFFFGQLGKFIVGVPQLLTPKTEEQHFLAAITFDMSQLAMPVGQGVSYGWWWLKDLLRRRS